MSPGSEPERDDSGLPPVDIEIPDDARELDRDVQAYYRELRASRRQVRSKRVHGMLSRDGMVLPLLISCLIFALITGTLLTLFTATSIDPALPRPANATGTHRASSSVTAAPSQLHTALVTVAGKPRELGDLGRAVLLLVPEGCSACGGAAGNLASLARARRVPTYLVSSEANLPKATATAKILGNGVQPAGDVSGELQRDIAQNGLTAIFVTAGGSVTYAQGLQSQSDFTPILAKAGF